MARYLTDESRAIAGSFYWSLNPGSGDTGGILLSWRGASGGTVHRSKLELLRALRATHLPTTEERATFPKVTSPPPPLPRSALTERAAPERRPAGQRDANSAKAPTWARDQAASARPIVRTPAAVPSEGGKTDTGAGAGAGAFVLVPAHHGEDPNAGRAIRGQWRAPSQATSRQQEAHTANVDSYTLTQYLVGFVFLVVVCAVWRSEIEAFLRRTGLLGRKGGFVRALSTEPVCSDQLQDVEALGGGQIRPKSSKARPAAEGEEGAEAAEAAEAAAAAAEAAAEAEAEAAATKEDSPQRKRSPRAGRRAPARAVPVDVEGSDDAAGALEAPSLAQTKPGWARSKARARDVGGWDEEDE